MVTNSFMSKLRNTLPSALSFKIFLNLIFVVDGNLVVVFDLIGWA